jgi:hypothetical protein
VSERRLPEAPAEEVGVIPPHEMPESPAAQQAKREARRAEVNELARQQRAPAMITRTFYLRPEDEARLAIVVERAKKTRETEWEAIAAAVQTGLISLSGAHKDTRKHGVPGVVAALCAPEGVERLSPILPIDVVRAEKLAASLSVTPDAVLLAALREGLAMLAGDARACRLLSLRRT